jgi:hypothetical protein
MRALNREALARLLAAAEAYAGARQWARGVWAMFQEATRPSSTPRGPATGQATECPPRREMLGCSRCDSPSNSLVKRMAAGSPR